MGKFRILIPNEEWTPFDNRVFTHDLRKLKGKRSAALYLYLYDKAYHSGVGMVAETASRLAGLTGSDPRAVQHGLEELQQVKLIYNACEGVRRSRSQTDSWVVARTGLDLKNGKWTPVPRLITRKYMHKVPNAVLLPMLLFHQHMHWRNECWVGVPRLSKLLNWSKTRVQDSLRTMFRDDDWSKLKTGFPRPLTCTSVKNPKTHKRSRHFTVLAMTYTGQKTESRRTVSISPAFRDL
jgi:hypothetical protein